MKGTSTKRGVVVGIFIFVGLIIFATAILVLGGQRKSFIQSVQVKALFHDVGGLAKGDNIWFSGVKVGTIRKISFVDHNRIEVLMDIEKSSRQFIRKDVVAKVSTDGLVGNKIIALTGGSSQAQPIENGDQLAVATTISSDELMNTLQVNNKNLVEITGNLKNISRNIMNGQGTLGRLINDSSVFIELDQTMVTLRKTMANTQLLTEGLADYAKKLQTKGSLSNDLISDTIVFSKLRSTTVELEAASQKANDMVGNLKEITTSVNEKLGGSESAAGVLLNDPEAAEDLKATLSNLESTTQKLDVNMEALRSNFLFRRYFRNQEKAEKKRVKDSLKNANR
ncbi:MlaD family protein [Chitinophaga cymbidii]|uniref:ABC transporter substrate-binding protein n=1 Tax=Chitinophaga cymbidii TaxID=1096750 RepID=A0A512RNE4_9BACT|nr:MlaD family protein [Chitinophaga cymbidii]GEP97217.1 ABC transporter substrate-binding protein [Chitinophaga cymbidii]